MKRDGWMTLALIVMGAIFVLGALALNFFWAYESLPLKLVGLTVFFAGGVIAMLGFCRLGGDAERWAKPISLLLTFIGVMLLAASQFDDERKAVAGYSVSLLESRLNDAKSEYEELLPIYGDDPTKYEERHDIAMQHVVAEAYQVMSRYCTAKLEELVQEIETTKPFELPSDGNGNQPADMLKATLEANLEAGYRQGRGCDRLEIIAGWFASDAPSIDAAALENVRIGKATTKELDPLFAQAPRVFRHMRESSEFQADPDGNIPSFSYHRPSRDDLARRKNIDGQLAKLQDDLSKAKKQLERLAAAAGTSGVVIAQTVNLAIWTFALVLAVAIDSALWLHGLSRRAAEGA